jgi:hypothetical protein
MAYRFRNEISADSGDRQFMEREDLWRTPDEGGSGQAM